MNNQNNAGLALGLIKSQAARRAERAEGIAWARRWRERNKPIFDAMYGPDHGPGDFCSKCGRRG